MTVIGLTRRSPSPFPPTQQVIIYRGNDRSPSADRHSLTHTLLWECWSMWHYVCWHLKQNAYLYIYSLYILKVITIIINITFYRCGFWAEWIVYLCGNIAAQLAALCFNDHRGWLYSLSVMIGLHSHNQIWCIYCTHIVNVYVRIDIYNMNMLLLRNEYMSELVIVDIMSGEATTTTYWWGVISSENILQSHMLHIVPRWERVIV